MRCLIVEDDRKLALFLSRALSEVGYTVDICGVGTDAVQQVRAGKYDFLLLDWMIPGLDGLSVCRDLRQAGLTLPIIMVTARDGVGERVLGLRAGADDYVGKPFEMEELLARIEALLRRTTAVGKLTFGDLEIHRLGNRATLGGKPLDLTTREFGLLLHLAYNANKVVPRSELLAKVWGMAFDPGSNVIDVHIKNLRDKLGPYACMIDTVRGAGYRFRTDQVP
jgi:two-component system OmpR family response regulator